VLLSVVCAQVLGFMHGTVHAFHPGDRQTTHVAASAVPDSGLPVRAEHCTGADGWIKSLFSIHDEANDCRLFDGLGQQCLAPPASGFSPLLVPDDPVQRQLDGTFVARHAALFEARAPPSC
jgi:hypothetical protein